MTRRSPESEQNTESRLERFGTFIDSIRLWTTKAWKISLLMAKGAYLLSERRRLFLKLGEDVYYKIQKGEMRIPDLEFIVSQLDRLTKKVELEEMLIRNIRFGSKIARVQQEESVLEPAEGAPPDTTPNTAMDTSINTKPR